MTNLLKAVDFTTYGKSDKQIAQIVTNAAAFVQSGVGLWVIGFDGTAASAAVRNACIQAAAFWDPYRFLYSSSYGETPQQQMQGVIDAIRAQQPLLPLPGYLHMDIEPAPNGSVPTIAEIEAAMDTVEANDIKPQGTEVKPSIYSAPWVWNEYYPGYTGPADRGWYCWGAWWNQVADLTVQLFGGFKPEQVVGHQYSGNADSLIGPVDFSAFAPRGVTPSPQPQPQPDVAGALPIVQTLIASLTGDLANAQAVLGKLVP